MGYILHIFLALASLAAVDVGLTSSFELPFAVALACLVPHGLAFAAKHLLVRGRFKIAGWVDRVLVLSPPVLQIVAISVLGWGSTVERWWGFEVSLSRWPGPALALGVLPFLVFQLVAIDARARLLGRAQESKRNARSFQVRLFLSSLLPFTLYVVLSMLIGTSDAIRVHIEEVSLLSAAFTVALLTLFVLFLPGLLRRTWDTAPIEHSGLRASLEDVAARAGFRCRELLVWKTGNQMANAAIVGFTPRSRIVLFSDALLAYLDPRELAAVFAHEIGHAKKHHAAIFGTFALLFFLGADLALTAAEVRSESIVAATFGIVLVLWYASFGFLSRRFELQADLVSLETMGESAPLVHALEEVGGTHGRSKSSWRHFSTEKRVEFLEEVEREPAIGRRLHRALRRWSWIGVTLVLVVIALRGMQLFSSMEEERVVADLRLGRYELAAERLDAGASVDERLAVLVRRGSGLEGGLRTPAELEGEALRTLERGELQAAVEILELAVLRGSELEGVLTVMDQLASEDDAGSSLEEADLPRPWRLALQAALSGA